MAEHRNDLGKRSIPQGDHQLRSEDTVYRYLCPLRKAGSIIGKGGDIVKQLRADTLANIKISEVTPGFDERIVTIYSSSEETNYLDDIGELVSPAQDALFIIHSRIVSGELAASSDNDDNDKPQQVVVRMLIPSDQIGCVIGKGGQVIQNIRQESRAQIRILKDEFPHPLALPTDELLQIMGEPTVVRKALYKVAFHLHENPSKSQHLFLPSMINHQSDGTAAIPRINHKVGQKFPSRYDQKDDASAREFSIRLVCPNENIGAVIGKGGGNVKQIRQESHANVKVDSSIAEGDDCLIFVSAKEVSGDYSPTMTAALALQPRCSSRTEKSSGEFVYTTRILVPKHQVGCLIGKGGSIISEIRNATRATIRILSDEIPSVASEDDGMVQITGGLDVARNALSHVVSRLKANLFGRD